MRLCCCLRARCCCARLWNSFSLSLLSASSVESSRERETSKSRQPVTWSLDASSFKYFSISGPRNLLYSLRTFSGISSRTRGSAKRGDAGSTVGSSHGSGVGVRSSIRKLAVLGTDVIRFIEVWLACRAPMPLSATSERAQGLRGRGRSRARRSCRSSCFAAFSRLTYSKYSWMSFISSSRRSCASRISCWRRLRRCRATPPASSAIF
mmetsp:Transcript_26365/g.55168  ORF Transcript_26365/g.55168 Transcript_26365/m.55168 type:complete len:208 (-) Transcript_26365:26-649(-)